MSNELVVAKAGGTSNNNAEAVAQSMSWAEQADIFVCSAPGKLEGDDPACNKVTDMLSLTRAQYVKTGEVDGRLTDNITERYSSIIHRLGKTVTLSPNWIKDITPRITEAVHQSEDAASMLGERLQAEIYEGAGWELLDPSRAPKDLAADQDLWRAWLNEAFHPGRKYILPGNTTKVDGRLKTFSRGGSDITGGLAAYAVHADLNINLTDGQALSADHRLIDRDKLVEIHHLLYEEGRELGRNGSGLVHPAAMVPLMLGNIPTEIRSTFDPSSPATILDNEISRASNRVGRVVVMSLMEDVVVQRIHEPGMAERTGRLAYFESALAARGIRLIDSKGDGVDAQKYFLEPNQAELASRVLSSATQGGTVETSDELSFVTLVGYRLESRILDIIAGLVLNPGLDVRTWQSEEHDLSYGKHSIRFSVSPKDARSIFERIHCEVIEKQALREKSYTDGQD
ncbi:MAG: amino acid kinase family protein [Candidatus Saccharimonadales bacterium]